MKKYLSMGALALALAGVPTQEADAGIKMHLGVGVDFSICGDGQFRCRPGRCGPRGQAAHIATFPGFEHHHHAQHHHPFPPPPGPGEPGRKDGERKGDEAAALWGYPSLNYSYYHPVSYQPAQTQQGYNPADYYYPPQYYYPPNTSTPSYYQAPGMTFDR